MFNFTVNSDDLVLEPGMAAQLQERLEQVTWLVRRRVSATGNSTRVDVQGILAQGIKITVSVLQELCACESSDSAIGLPALLRPLASVPMR